MNDHGIYTRAQLRATGLSDSSISRRYVRVLPQIYCADEPTTIMRCHAVSLWQPTAVLSHRTAAWLYGWIDTPPSIEASVPMSFTPRAPTWLRLYRRRLPDHETAEVQTLPVSGRQRTLVDCVAVMNPAEAARVVDQRLLQEMDPDAIEAMIRARPKMPGNTGARRQLRTRASGFASEPERMLDRALIARGLRLLTNHWVGRYLCDFVDELARVIVEVDGRAFHSAPEVFTNDRRRQNELVLDKWLVLRYSAVDVMTNPDRIAKEIVAVVRRRRDARR